MYHLKWILRQKTCGENNTHEDCENVIILDFSKRTHLGIRIHNDHATSMDAKARSISYFFFSFSRY